MKSGKPHVGNVRFGCLAFTVVAASLCIIALAPVALALPYSLGGAADYAILGIGGTVTVKSDFEVYQHDTVVNGNVGVGPYTEFTHEIDAIINGRLDYDTTNTLPVIEPGNITGGTHPMDMSGIVADALAADAYYAALTPTQTFATLSENQTIVGTGGLNVIRITGSVTLKETLTLQGGASDSFVFQLTTSNTGHILTLSGMNMILSGGVTADNILWDLHGTGGDIQIKAMAADQMVYGTFLAPYRSIYSDHGIVEGRLIGGGNGGELDVHSGSEITVPPPAVSEPATILLLGSGLVGLWGARKKFRE